MLMGLEASRSSIDLSLNDDKIEHVDKFKYLGVDLDPKICYVNDAQRITIKCKQAMGALNCVARKWTPRQVFKKLYSATIETMPLYAVEAWYPSPSWSPIPLRSSRNPPPSYRVR
uniref:Reverse transcriptase n=1 Tax=Acrobeloides nanus TaxID=290746 RepID=A0A914CBH2_9BILA